MSTGDPHAILALLDDLEMQAQGLQLAERAVEVGELSVAAYAELRLLARLHASTGREVRVAAEGGLEVRGRLARVGSDWLLVEDGPTAWFVHLTAVLLLTGLADGFVPDEALPLSSRLSMRAVLRRLAEDRHACALHLRGGRVVHGFLTRVAADFVEVAGPEAAESLVVPLAALTLVRSSAVAA